MLLCKESSPEISFWKMSFPSFCLWDPPSAFLRLLLESSVLLEKWCHLCNFTNILCIWDNQRNGREATRSTCVSSDTQSSETHLSFWSVTSISDFMLNCTCHCAYLKRSDFTIYLFICYFLSILMEKGNSQRCYLFRAMAQAKWK